MLRELIARYGVNAERAVMVGDTAEGEAQPGKPECGSRLWSMGMARSGAWSAFASRNFPSLHRHVDIPAAAKLRQVK